MYYKKLSLKGSTCIWATIVWTKSNLETPKRGHG